MSFAPLHCNVVAINAPRESTSHLCLISSYHSDGSERRKWENRVSAYVKPPTRVACAQIILYYIINGRCCDGKGPGCRGSVKEKERKRQWEGEKEWDDEKREQRGQNSTLALAQARAESPCEQLLYLNSLRRRSESDDGFCRLAFCAQVQGLI